MAGKRYAVLIGNGYFPSDTSDIAPRLPSLRCPVLDVTAMQELLAADEHGGYAVTALIDRPHNEARRSIYDCLRKAGPEDQVLVYYSGHGKLDESGSLYLAGSDTDPESLDPTALAAADVQKYVSESRAAARIVILDCCFSGAVGQVFLRGAAKGDLADQAGQALRRLEGQGVFYLTASTDTQTAEEKEHDRYSLLTKHIIDGLRDGAADTDDDGEVRFSELCRFVQEKVRLEGAQRPLVFTLKAYGDPVVTLTGRPALATRRDAVEQAIYELCRLKMLHGADAARILERMHRPPDAHALIESLHAARSDQALLLKTIHRFVELPVTTALAEPAGPTPVVSVTGPAAVIAPDTPRRRPERPAWTVPLAAVLLVVAIGGGVTATIWMFGLWWSTPASEANVAASSPTNPPVQKPEPMPTPLLSNGPSKLINGPSKLLSSPASKQ